MRTVCAEAWSPLILYHWDWSSSSPEISSGFGFAVLVGNILFAVSFIVFLIWWKIFALSSSWIGTHAFSCLFLTGQQTAHSLRLGWAPSVSNDKSHSFWNQAISSCTGYGIHFSNVGNKTSPHSVQYFHRQFNINISFCPKDCAYTLITRTFIRWLDFLMILFEVAVRIVRV